MNTRKHRPARAGERVTVQIEKVVFGGYGLARMDAGILLVPFVLAGETVEVEILRRSGSTLFGELIKLRSASLRRVTPQCRYYAECGGCAYQHAAYEEQLAMKLAQVKETLQRVGKIAEPPVSGIEPSQPELGYRNRLTVHAHQGVIGFHRRQSRTLVDIEECLLGEPATNQALSLLRKEGRSSGHFTVRRPGLSRAFHQTNEDVARKIQAWVEAAVPLGVDQLIDCYCGVGFFAKACRHKVAEILGIDRDLYNIEEARLDALPHESYECTTVEEGLRMLSPAKMSRAWFILDPPREGLSSQVRGMLTETPAAGCIYISCDPATLARDMCVLKESYHLVTVRAFDMFAQTAEIEVGAVLQRKGEVQE